MHCHWLHKRHLEEQLLQGYLVSVIPVKTGIHQWCEHIWIPAFAGMTDTCQHFCRPLPWKTKWPWQLPRSR